MTKLKLKRKQGYFSISAVAKMFSVHQQTIRLYEKEGLINPQRSEGNTRMFSEQDIEKLEEIIYLTHQLGINLAGVEMILKLQRKIRKMQKDMNKLFDTAQHELEQENEAHKDVMKQQAQELLRLQSLPKQQNTTTNSAKKADDSKNDDWDIDYNE